MRKQALALVTSGLLLASGFAAATELSPITGPLLNADGTPVSNTNKDQPKGNLGGYGGVALGAAAVGLGLAAASDSGGGSGSSTATNTTP